MAIRTELFKHQKEAIACALERGYYGILHQPGLGKTLTALGVIDDRVSRNPAYKTLVVCPATLIENWQDEAQKHTTLTAVSLVGSKTKRSMLLNAMANIYIINYEGTRIMTDELVARRFNLVVFDESHSLKNHTSQQSKAGFRIAMSCPQRIIMTGTPIMNCPLDVFAQYRALSPDIFGKSYYSFRATYAIMGGYLGKMVLKYINTDRLKFILQKNSHIKTKEECLDLPPKLYEVVRVDLTPDQARMYKQLREQFISAYKDAVVTAPVMLTRLMRFSQITAGFYKDIEGKEHSYEKNPKHEWLVEWLKETGAKTVVFVRFIHELKALEEALARASISSVSVYGETHNRIDVVKRFNSDPKTQVFIGQIDTAGQGINLQSASYCVFLSNNYSYGDREQAESRIHRAGQTAKNCTYIDVVARGTIDESVLKILKKKESLAGLLTSDIIKVV
jgi:SNF2 family DNA or RNA helicase